MRIGLYFDLRNPPGWRSDWARTYAFTLEMCEEAEHLGADSVWFTEHHCFEDGYLTQPLTMAAAAAARTTRLRLGTAVVIAPFRKAAQLAEEAAAVDLISDGRLDLGLGAGYRHPEFDLFGADFDRRYETTDQTVRDLRRLWSDPVMMPPTVQERVPILMGYHGPQGARRAGRLGEGLLTINRASLEPYLDGLVEGGHDRSHAVMSGTVPSFVSEDPERDWPLVSKHLAYQLDSYRRYMAEGTDLPAPRPVDPERVIASRGNVLSSCIFGTPELVAAEVRAAVAGCPVDTLFFMPSLAGMPEDIVANTVATICNHLAPLLRRDADAAKT